MQQTTHHKFWQLDQSYADLPSGYFHLNAPESLQKPEVIYYNLAMAKALGLPSEPNAEALSGQLLYEDMRPLSQGYAGHQFGTFTMLGDGRAHLLGELSDHEGRRFDIQLKGSGKTPYSRGGDGKAGLGPVLREYLMGEAMTALGIASTRGLAVLTTGEQVIRERVQKGAILVRVASSHLRVGTFQLAAARNDLVGLSKLAEYAIQRHYPAARFDENPYAALLKQVCEAQGQLIAKWQLVGFVHGVMNTDNVSIAGETIDYGPCAFLDHYSQRAVFSSIDEQGRYAFGNQPFIGGWNMARLAEAFLPLLSENEDSAKAVAQTILEHYYNSHLEAWRKGFGHKIGLNHVNASDDELFSELLNLMEANNLDFTNTFVYLTEALCGDTEAPQNMGEVLSQWQTRWQNRLAEEGQSKQSAYVLMSTHNPKRIPRNHLVDTAITQAEQGDFSHFNKLLATVKHPFERLPEEPLYQGLNPSGKPHKTYCGT